MRAATVKALSHQGCPIEGNRFLEELADRELLLKNGRMTTVLFIRCKQKKKEGKTEPEISGYIDLAHRMQKQDFR
jgi:hypothetical protein